MKLKDLRKLLRLFDEELAVKVLVKMPSSYQGDSIECPLVMAKLIHINQVEDRLVLKIEMEE